VVAGDNAVYAFGGNVYGQLGEDEVHNLNVPTKIRAEYYGNKPVATVHARFNSSCVITKSNEVFVWGAVSHTDIGNVTNIFWLLIM
jgi:alpha-tubulin suppressor-like RCC1 family protein